MRQYFDKIKSAEDSEEKKRLGIDKAAAGRFIKHAIAQAKLVKVQEPSDMAHGPASTSSERVPVKITSKMAERAEYEKNLEELGSEEEEDCCHHRTRENHEWSKVKSQNVKNK